MPCEDDWFRIFTATGVPLSNWPTYTDPNPPFPISSQKSFVMFLSSLLENCQFSICSDWSPRFESFPFARTEVTAVNLGHGRIHDIHLNTIWDKCKTTNYHKINYLSVFFFLHTNIINQMSTTTRITTIRTKATIIAIFVLFLPWLTGATICTAIASSSIKNKIKKLLISNRCKCLGISNVTRIIWRLHSIDSSIK